MMINLVMTSCIWFNENNGTSIKPCLALNMNRETLAMSQIVIIPSVTASWKINLIVKANTN